MGTVQVHGPIMQQLLRSGTDYSSPYLASISAFGVNGLVVGEAEVGEAQLLSVVGDASTGQQ